MTWKLSNEIWNLHGIEWLIFLLSACNLIFLFLVFQSFPLYNLSLFPEGNQISQASNLIWSAISLLKLLPFVAQTWAGLQWNSPFYWILELAQISSNQRGAHFRTMAYTKNLICEQLLEITLWDFCPFFLFEYHTLFYFSGHVWIFFCKLGWAGCFNSLIYTEPKTQWMGSGWKTLKILMFPMPAFYHSALG